MKKKHIIPERISCVRCARDLGTWEKPTEDDYHHLSSREADGVGDNFEPGPYCPDCCPLCNAHSSKEGPNDD